MGPFVSVIIPCFNAAKYLAEAVNSVLSQTFTDLECIIVDDGSTDNTRQIASTLRNRDVRVKYLFKKRGGVSSARNFGIQNAKGRWIQLLDSDDLLHKDKIRFQVDASGKCGLEEFVILYSDYEVFWEDDANNITQREIITVGELDKRQLIERLMNGGFKANLPLNSNNMLFKRGIFDKKLFNERLRAYEDMEVWVDLVLRKDISFIYTPICGMYYRIHQSNTTRDHSFMRHAYIDFLKEVHKKDKNLLKLTPHVGNLIFLGLKSGDHRLVDSLIGLVDLTDAPVYLNDKKRIEIGSLLIKLYRARLLFPLATLWYGFKNLWRRLWGRIVFWLLPLASHFTPRS